MNNWHESLEYKDGELFWTIDLGNGVIYPGKEAGYIHGHAEWQINYNRKKYPYKQVVCEMHYGYEIDPNKIKRISSNRHDNSIENLYFEL